MDIQTFQTFLSSVGFPIAVAMWLLYRTDKKEEKTQEILSEIKEILAVIKEKNS